MIADPQALEQWRAQIYKFPDGIRDSPRELLGTAIYDTFSHYERSMFQCRSCGRLWLEDDYHWSSFKPEAADGSTTLLASVEHKAWRMAVFGFWSGKSGRIEVDRGNELYEEFDNWDLMEVRYHQIVEDVQQRNRLRSALLRKDGRLIHLWPPLRDGQKAE